jgi:Putative zinc ribbon domain
MLLKKDQEGGGSETDGSKSQMYCSYCYEDGTFKQPECTSEQMQKFSKNKMKEMGFPGFIAGMFTEGILKLKRWKK